MIAALACLAVWQVRAKLVLVHAYLVGCKMGAKVIVAQVRPVGQQVGPDLTAALVCPALWRVWQLGFETFAAHMRPAIQKMNCNLIAALKLLAGKQMGMELNCSTCALAGFIESCCTGITCPLESMTYTGTTGCQRARAG